MPVDTNADHTDSSLQQEGLGPQHGDYSVERVEQVYRKIDRRIIPGKSSTTASILRGVSV